MAPKVAPFGTWDSPISASYVAKAGVSYDDVLVDSVPSRAHPNGNGIYHIEKRPAEAGRNVIVDSSSKKDVFGKGWNARSAVQEYGGASTIVHAGIVYFTNFGDFGVYKVDRNVEGAELTPVTPNNKNHRFANFAVHPTSPHLLVSILEDHTNPAPSDVVTTLVTINTQTVSIHPLVSGADFYSSSVFNPDGTRLAWVQWNHPDMPWDGAQVYVADVSIAKDADSEKLELKNERKIKGTWKKESAVRPQWVDANAVLFFSDESGFQNPWIIDLSNCSSEPRPVLPSPVDQDFSDPDWLLGGASAAVLSSSSALVATIRDVRSVLYLLDLKTGTLKGLASPYVVVKNIRRTGPHSAVFLGVKNDEPLSVVHVSFDESEEAKFTPLAGADANSSEDAEKIDKSFFSSPVPLSLKTRDGFPLYAIFYEPTNPNYIGPEGEKPPCIVNVHGGPTGMADQGFKLRSQYFTSRGFAWMDVNYGGSSGYGRKYIERLDGDWGITDVCDCVDAVQALSSPPSNSINPSRVLITGGSAGGYTVLQSLCTGRSSTYAAGTSSYGVSNLFTLVEDTHKFESKYMDKLLGGTARDISYVYRARSPVFHAEQITVPLLLLQGADDKVVPPSQAEDMLKVIRERGGQVEYKLFDGEGHGWRRAETIIAALETELDFYVNVMYNE
ncbi:hypothetical protein ACEPAF_2125 [Sanghuangporus sanghuang]